MSVRQEISARQAVSLTTIAIAAGYVREDPFPIEEIRRKSEFYFIFASVWSGKKSTVNLYFLGMDSSCDNLFLYRPPSTRELSKQIFRGGHT
ncbi:hypothetical protein AVEN_257780-1 [Araneus ventricosus]|uniref:Uncharacterized protein n=1 Tax=Araneus ventricosus TaxID=182803 RepID=A0A4Y2UB99_ARAVE|nr:hypothetical protein AVEN_257780-1 [Araneus ventricosus]